MLEFRWIVPEPGQHEVSLQLMSRRSWLTSKRLLLDGQVLYRRGPITGIDSEFYTPSSGQKVLLINEPVENTPQWRPALYVDGVRVPELTPEVSVPTIVPRPHLFGTIVGIALLAVFICVTSFSAIEGVATRITNESASVIRMRWILPVLLSIPCLGGYWEMRRWGPLLYLVLFLGQLVLHFGKVWEISLWALIFQAFLVVFGFVYYKQMR